MSEAPVVGMDAELQALLTDLQEPMETAVPQGALPENIPDILAVPDPVLSDVIDLEQTEPPILPIDPSPTATNIADLQAVVEKFDADYGEVQANLKRDRGKIDAVIDILLQRVRTNADAETDTMSLVKALDVLANTNGHAVKLLDSRSKLLAATKSTINANQTNVNVSGTDAELQKILSQSGV